MLVGTNLPSQHFSFARSEKVWPKGSDFHGRLAGWPDLVGVLARAGAPASVLAIGPNRRRRAGGRMSIAVCSASSRTCSQMRVLRRAGGAAIAVGVERLVLQNQSRRAQSRAGSLLGWSFHLLGMSEAWRSESASFTAPLAARRPTLHFSITA